MASRRSWASVVLIVCPCSGCAGRITRSINASATGKPAAVVYGGRSLDPITDGFTWLGTLTRRNGHANARALKCAQRAVRNCESLARDRKSTRLNSSHVKISYAVFCLKKKTAQQTSYGDALARAVRG